MYEKDENQMEKTRTSSFASSLHVLVEALFGGANNQSSDGQPKENQKSNLTSNFHKSRIARSPICEYRKKPRPASRLGGIMSGEYVIEKILRARRVTRRKSKGKKRRHSRLEFFVKWHNYPPPENTWEPPQHLPNPVYQEAKRILDETKELAPDHVEGAIPTNPKFKWPVPIECCHAVVPLRLSHVVSEWIVNLEVDNLILQPANDSERIQHENKESKDPKPVKVGRRGEREEVEVLQVGEASKERRQEAGMQASSSSTLSSMNVERRTIAARPTFILTAHANSTPVTAPASATATATAVATIAASSLSSFPTTLPLHRSSYPTSHSAATNRKRKKPASPVAAHVPRPYRPAAHNKKSVSFTMGGRIVASMLPCIRAPATTVSTSITTVPQSSPSLLPPPSHQNVLTPTAIGNNDDVVIGNRGSNGISGQAGNDALHPAKRAKRRSSWKNRSRKRRFYASAFFEEGSNPCRYVVNIEDELRLVVPFPPTKSVHDFCKEISARVRRHRLFPSLASAVKKMRDDHSISNIRELKLAMKIGKLTLSRYGEPLQSSKTLHDSITPEATVYGQFMGTNRKQPADEGVGKAKRVEGSTFENGYVTIEFWTLSAKFLKPMQIYDGRYY
eukprot:jgi/Bigna1/91015/estExt_fgenesh1_pg.C_860001